MNRMEILSPAKINLFLYITGKRPDGYHNIYSLMSCVDLYDSIHLDFSGTEISVECNKRDVPENSTNLAFRAADIFYKEFGKYEGLKIKIRKKIPVGAGLGGGSSNAASVLSALNRYYDSPFPYARLCEIGRELGADVPFFISGRSSIATGIGEKLAPYDFPLNFHVLIVYPDIHISTKEVYKKLNLGLTKPKNKFTYSLFKYKDFCLESDLVNDLETVTLDMFPEIFKIKLLLLKKGADGALMSGSGSAVFGLFRDSRKFDHAHIFFKNEKKWQVFQTEII